MSASGKKAAPGAIDLESLISLTDHHLSVAAKRARDFDQPWPGSMANYLLKIDELLTQFEEAGDAVAQQQLASRVSSFFITGFDFGLAVAAAVISDPFGKPAAGWADALKDASGRLREYCDNAIKDAASIRADSEQKS